MIAWLAGQQKAYLCVASSIRAMPETEIPPAMAGGYLLYHENHAIVAWFYIGFADEQKANENSA